MSRSTLPFARSSLSLVLLVASGGVLPNCSDAGLPPMPAGQAQSQGQQPFVEDEGMEPEAVAQDSVAYVEADPTAFEPDTAAQQEATPEQAPVEEAEVELEQTTESTESVDGAGLGTRPPPEEEPADMVDTSVDTSTEIATEETTDLTSDVGTVDDTMAMDATSVDTEAPVTGDVGGGLGGFGGGDTTMMDPAEATATDGTTMTGDTSGGTDTGAADTGTGAGTGDTGTGDTGSGDVGAGFGGGAIDTGGGATAAGDCVALSVGDASGDVGTEAACYVVTGTMAGWQVSNLGDRTLTINGAPGEPPTVPADVGGEYRFEFSAGDPSYTAFSTW